MTLDTMFDVASLTKVVATTTAVMMLLEDGKVRLIDPVARSSRSSAKYGKERITVRDMMTHMSGLRPDVDLGDPWDGPRRGDQSGRRGDSAGAARPAVHLQRHQLLHARRNRRARQRR